MEYFVKLSPSSSSSQRNLSRRSIIDSKKKISLIEGNGGGIYNKPCSTREIIVTNHVGHWSGKSTLLNSYSYLIYLLSLHKQCVSNYWHCYNICSVEIIYQWDFLDCIFLTTHELIHFNYNWCNGHSKLWYIVKWSYNDNKSSVARLVIVLKTNDSKRRQSSSICQTILPSMTCKYIF